MFIQDKGCNLNSKQYYYSLTTEVLWLFLPKSPPNYHFNAKNMNSKKIIFLTFNGKIFKFTKGIFIYLFLDARFDFINEKIKVFEVQKEFF